MRAEANLAAPGRSALSAPMSHPLLNRVRAFLAAHRLLRPEARLLVAVSGGPDSLCLLHLLDQLRAAGGPHLFVAHLDHSLRPEAAAEAAFVADLAASWGLPARVERRDVRAQAARWRLGLPAAARRVRYAFLAECALDFGADAVAVAHQADDQAETVLLHILRGAGPAGLRGMRALVPGEEWAVAEDAGIQRDKAAPPLIRPLLGATRAEILAYCAAYGLEPRDDRSNRDERYTRARLRHSLLPALEAAHPGAAAALTRTASICAEDYDFIQTQLDASWPDLALVTLDAVRMHADVWKGLHPALQRYALRRAAATLGQDELSLAQVEAARALGPGHHMVLGPGLLLEVDQAGLSLRRPESAPPIDGPQLADDELPLAVPGETPLGGGWICRVQAEAPAEPDRWWTCLDAGSFDGPLLLRRRRPGERMRPVGGRGSRSLQDLMVDAKIPAPLRAAWPLLATAKGLIWPAGLRADARFAATPATQATIWVGIVRTSHNGGR